MKKVLLSVVIILSITTLNAQVGIGTNDPKTTLEVVGKPDVASSPDGVMAPKITRAELIAKTAYTSDQTGAIIFVTDLSGTTNSATSNVLQIGYYYFDGLIWQNFNANSSSHNFGDVKTGIQSSDHSGWIKIDGRAKSTLTVGQQAQATTLGIGANLPDATGSVLMQNGTALGSVSGTNSKTIAQSNLPNVSLNYARISSFSSDNLAGSSSGAINTTGTANLLTGWTGNGRINLTSTNNNTTSSINGGITQTALDITPRSLSVNTFIYLGN